MGLKTELAFIVTYLLFDIYIKIFYRFVPLKSSNFFKCNDSK
jgi:hypothetical protein